MYRAMLVLILLAIVESLPAVDNPFVGTWTANLSKSKLLPDYQYKPVMLQIAVVFDTVTLGSKFATASGQELTAADLFHTDGKEHPGTLSLGVLHTARWIDARTLETRAKKGGKDMGVMTYEVSADGKTLTNKYSMSPQSPQQVVVFDRQE
jgi:hypothetical protein